VAELWRVIPESRHGPYDFKTAATQFYEVCFAAFIPRIDQQRAERGLAIPV
jgi:hypothetical protein